MTSATSFEKLKQTILAIDPDVPRHTITLTHYPAEKVEALLAHDRAVTELLKKHEWSGIRDWGQASCCPECSNYPDAGHTSDCELKRLIGDEE